MADLTLEVDASDVICRAEPRVLGINVDYLVDHDANRGPGARPLAEALKEMRVRSLRYPGGDKSDNYLWSVPPYDRPRPTLVRGPTEGREKPLLSPEGQWKVRLLDFDEFIALCSSLGAEPTVVACYDALHVPGCAVKKKQLVEAAAAWVEYANVKRGYAVKYWEIGNEGYIDTTVNVRDYARDLVDFAKAMKRADPSIKIGANGPPRAEGTGRERESSQVPWWKVVFEQAADHIDFAAVHLYTCWQWGSYETYRDHSPGYPEAERDARGVVEAARRWGPAGFAERLRVAVTELNSADWSEQGWERTNDLGHGLVTFDILGTLLEYDQVDMAQLWNTRWVSHPPDQPSLWDAVDDDNQLQPTGRALAIWSEFLHDQMVRVTEPPGMRTFASYSPDSGKLSIFLISKDAVPRSALVRVRHCGPPASARRWLWSGAGPADPRPIWSGPEEIAAEQAHFRVPLPPDSLTVVELAGR